MRSRLIFVVALVLAACGGSPPPPAGSSDAERFAKLEARLEALEKQAADPKGEKTIDEVEAEMEQAVTGKKRARSGQVFAVPVAGSPSEGPADAWVTIVEGYEYACPFCDHVRGTITKLRKDYGSDVRVVYKHFLVHPDVATPSALAACAAHAQGKFSEMNELIWTQGFARRDITEAKMLELARSLKLKMEKFQKDMRGICAETIRRDQAELARASATGTPSFFINGRLLQGALPIEHFKLIIDEELQKAKNSGVPKEKYYQHVLDSAGG